MQLSLTFLVSASLTVNQIITEDLAVIMAGIGKQINTMLSRVEVNASHCPQLPRDLQITRKLPSIDGIHSQLFCSEYAQYLCSGKSPGYIYNEAVPLCYKIDSDPRTLVESVSFCGESGGHLLQIDTDREQKLVEKLRLEGTAAYRIDGIKIGGKWKFLDGTPITQVYWYPGEPGRTDLDDLSIGLRVGYHGKWDDVFATASQGNICEKNFRFD